MDFVYDPNLVLYLPLHELDGSSFVSKDGHAHVATVTGAPWTSQGRIFDGVDDQILVNNHAAFTFGAGDFAIGLWLKAAVPATEQVVIRKGFAVAFYVYLSVDGTATFKCENAGSEGITFSGAIDNDWHFIWVERRNGQLYAFRDGNPAASPVACTRDVTNSLRLHVGAGANGSDGPSQLFAGAIGEVAIFNQAKALPEIQAFYLATKWRYR